MSQKYLPDKKPVDDFRFPMFFTDFDGIPHTVDNDGRLMMVVDEMDDGQNVLMLPALENPQPKPRHNRKSLKPGEMILRDGRVMRAGFFQEYPMEVRLRAVSLALDHKFTYEKVQQQIALEFQMTRVPSIRVIKSWMAKFYKKILHEEMLPEAMKAELEILTQRVDLRTLQKAVENVENRAFGKPVQPVAQATVHYDMRDIYDEVSVKNDDKDETPSGQWT